jgi:hypothetical protein
MYGGSRRIYLEIDTEISVLISKRALCQEVVPSDLPIKLQLERPYKELKKDY